MNRKISFRGKLSHSKQWVKGHLITDLTGQDYIIPTYVFEPDGHHLRIDSDNPFWVDLETVGQFTGLTDKDGKEIYEGDIIEDNNGIGVIIWFQTGWGVASYAYGYNGLKSYTAVDSYYTNEAKEWSVIGNIIDNLELIK